MKTIWVVTIVLLIPLAISYGQQDSLIVDSIYVEQGQTFVSLQTFGVTFDSVGGYAVALACNAPLGGVRISQPVSYYPPINAWDILFDTLYSDGQGIGLLGLYYMGGGDPPDPIYTNGLRATLWSMRILIDPDAPPQIVTIDTLHAFSFGDNPAFRRGYIIIGPLTEIDDGYGRIPRTFTLSQNYPNPFNAQTTISYFLPQAGPVTLSIYNIMGQKVAGLFDGMQEAGEHNIIWDAKDNPSGIYLYDINAGEYTETRRMILLK
jgi:hypothetical protein